MKTFIQNRGKRLLASFISILAVSAIINTPAQAKSPPNIVTNIAWSAGYAGVNDITAAFNNARRGEEAQLGLAANTLGSLMLPDQSTWNGMSDDAKALYLINSERAARANMQAGVIGLPLAGIESHIDTVAKNYAQLLHDTDTTGHCQPSGDCNIDSPFIRIANSVGSTCKEFITRGENLYYAAASNSSYGSASIQLPVEYAIYTWIYADAGSSWGHREAVLLQNTALPDNVGGFNNNYGSTSNEGFLGFQRLGSSNYAPFPGYGYGVVVVMNVFDPVSDAKAANCGYSLTLRTEDLPSPGNTTNRAPTANADSVTTAFGTSADIAVLDNDTDPDTDTLSITAHTNPSHGSVAVNGGVFTYTPTTGFSGVDSFSYTISDGNGHTATALVTITVSPAPSPSLDAVDDSATTEFNTPIEFNVLANDLNPAGGVLTISANTTPPSSAGTLSLTKSGTSVGKAKFTPKQGYSGKTAFTYTIRNSQGKTDTATVNITVKAGVPPTPANDSATTEYNTPVTLNLLDNDGSPKPTIVSNTSPTAGGKVTLNKTTGVMTYTPKSGFSGADSFSYTVKNASGLTAVATVTITVKAGVPPTPANDAATTEYNTPVTLNLLDNDGSPKPTIVSNTSPTAGGKVTLNKTTGVMTYTPKSGFSGTDSFNYTVKNASGLTAPATVTITVKAGVPPTPVDDSATTKYNTPVTLNLLDNDGSPKPTIVSNTTPVAGGRVTLNKTTGAMTYTPKSGFSGTDSFSYTVKNASGLTAPAAVTITVQSNAAPTANGGWYEVGVNRARLIKLGGNDPDGDAVSVKSYTTPAHGKVSKSGSNYYYTPNAGYVGQDSFSYTVTDPFGAQGSATIWLNVTATPSS